MEKVAVLSCGKLTHRMTLNLKGLLKSKSKFQFYSCVLYEVKLFIVAQKVTPVTCNMLRWTLSEMVTVLHTLVDPTYSG